MALAKWANLELVEVNNPWLVKHEVDYKSMWEWGDCVGVFRKPELAADTNHQFLIALRNHVSKVSAISKPFVGVQIPHSRHSYMSTKAMLKFRAVKHLLSRKKTT